MDKIKAVIFDMDGVLIDAKEWHYEALNKALRLFGFEISRYDHLVTFDGLPTAKKLEMMTVERGLPKSLHQLINDMKQIYTMEYVYMKCKPLFVHQYALSRLKSEGFRLALASNSVRVTIDDTEFNITAINRLGLSPEECLVVEDNQNGVKAALASGANLLKVETINDVTYSNIINRINEIENNI